MVNNHLCIILVNSNMPMDPRLDEKSDDHAEMMMMMTAVFFLGFKSSKEA